MSPPSRSQLRLRAQTDLHYLCSEVLGHRDIHTDLHRGMCRLYESQRTEPFTLRLAPRGHLKTSIWTHGGIVQEMLRNPDIRICLISAKAEVAVAMLRVIRAQFETNDRLRYLFPEFCIPVGRTYVRAHRWTDHAFELPNRSRRMQEATLTVMGAEASLVSQHYDIMDYDDAVNDLNTATAEYRDKMWGWFLDSWQLRHDPFKSIIRVKGTRWHYDDIYGRIIAAELEHRKKTDGAKIWQMYRRRAVEDGSPIWPERFSLVSLAQLRDMIGGYKYSCQYENEPVPEADAVLRWGRVAHISAADLPLELTTYASALVRAGAEDGPFDVALVASVDVRGNIYIRDLSCSSYTSSRLLDDLGFWHKVYGLRQVFLDKSLVESTLDPMWRMNRPTNRLPVGAVDRVKASRLKRIMALEPAVSNRQVFVVEDCPHLPKLREEFDQMSLSGSKGHDGILLCLSDIFRYGLKAVVPEASYPAAGSFDEAFGRLPSPAMGESGYGVGERLRDI